MTPELSSFSNWTLALLPRLFLYPGGLWLLVMLMAARLAAGGTRAITLRALSADLGSANLLSLAVAWAAVALSPLPGAAPLSSPVDSLVLAGLPILSLYLDPDSLRGREALAAGAITLSLLLPAIEDGTLLVRPDSSLGLLIVAALATLFGLLALSIEGDRAISGRVRWLAWLCLGVVPLWQQLLGDKVWTGSAFVLAVVLVLSSARNILQRTQSDGPHTVAFAQAALIIAWLPALGGLLWLLLAG